MELPWAHAHRTGRRGHHRRRDGRVGRGAAGGGAMASRGRSVAVLEMFLPGHRSGSSHGSARIFRRAYPDPLYVRLTGEAQRLWRQLADEAGGDLVLTTGGVDLAPA